MSVVVGVLDHYCNIDVIIFVDVNKKKLIWVPRDLYCHRIKNRINTAYHKGGSDLFIKILNGIGLKAKHCIIVWPEACINVFKNLTLFVPIYESDKYLYPLRPFTPIESGAKIISFNPPGEELSGERIHQFLGARFRIDKLINLPDLHRIIRQMVFIKQLIKADDFKWQQFISEKILISDSDAIQQIKQVTCEYRCVLYRSYLPFKVRNMNVLLKKTWYVHFLKIYLRTRAIIKKNIYLRTMFKSIRDLFGASIL